MAKMDSDELIAAVERHAPMDDAHGTAVAALNLSRFSTPTELSPILYEPCLCIVARGGKEVLLAGDSYRLDPVRLLLVSVDLPVHARVVEASPGRSYLGIRISLDSAVVGELLAEGANAPPLASATRALAITPLEPVLLDAITRLMRLLDSPEDVALLSPLILREITYRLLTGPQGLRLRQIASAGAPAQRIASAIRWIRGHFVEPLRIEVLAKRVKMSPSALHLHFKSVTALTPLQYQKQLRLQEARRLMYGDGIDASEAAFRVGYESPSQFSREYRRAFGAPPRQDVATLKGAVQVAS